MTIVCHFSRICCLAVAALLLSACGKPKKPDQAQKPEDDPEVPKITHGVASGDVSLSSAIIWSRADRPAHMIVEWKTHGQEAEPWRVDGPDVLETDDFTGKLLLTDLPPGTPIRYSVRFQSLENLSKISQPEEGRFTTAPFESRAVRFAWSGDTAGQGWGINPEWGGMKMYETMRQANPDFFIHSGDVIYADNPITEEVKLDEGGKWKNLVTPEKSKVAETLDEFRGNYKYNLLDHNLRRFQAEVPLLVQWDDHETTNNWYPDEQLSDDKRYTVKSSALLAARAKRAFFEYMPIRSDPTDPGRIYRKIPYGPDLDIFLIDKRSYRAPNNPNRQAEASSETAYLGESQLSWLEYELIQSSATWKIIASDMPIGLMVRDGEEDFENIANGDGPPLGRELELAQLLSKLKENHVSNVVWLTADVHYAAAHHYSPERAQFKDFLPFWEFVSGPINAGTFGPNELDNTFGPEVKFLGIPKDMKPNRPPSAGYQFFGLVELDAKSKDLTVKQCNVAGEWIYQVTVPAALPEEPVKLDDLDLNEAPEPALKANPIPGMEAPDTPEQSLDPESPQPPASKE